MADPAAQAKQTKRMPPGSSDDSPGAPGASPCVLVTRPQPQADAWVKALRASGQAAAALPLLRIGAPLDASAARASFDRLAQPASIAAVMFVSPSAVACWHALAPAGWTWPDTVLAGSTGPGTCSALLAAGVPVDAIVTPPAEGGQFDSEALWALMAARRAWAGATVLVVRGDGGRDWLAQQLAAAGAQVQFVSAYRRLPPRLDEAECASLARALARPAEHCWLFSSSEALSHLPALAPHADWSSAKALATHPRIAQMAILTGFTQVALVTADVVAVAAALRAWPGSAVAEATGPARYNQGSS